MWGVPPTANLYMALQHAQSGQHGQGASLGRTWRLWAAQPSPGSVTTPEKEARPLGAQPWHQVLKPAVLAPSWQRQSVPPTANLWPELGLGLGLGLERATYGEPTANLYTPRGAKRPRTCARQPLGSLLGSGAKRVRRLGHAWDCRCEP